MKKLKQYKKGFTLIELLVVIAIIGILSAVVIVNLNSARSKGQDAAIKSQMQQVRSGGVLYYDTNYGFGTATLAANSATAACTTFATSMFTLDSAIARAVAGITTNAGSAPQFTLGLSGTATQLPQSWVMTVPLRSVSGSSWCVDSNGTTKQITTGTAITNAGAGTTAVSCP